MARALVPLWLTIQGLGCIIGESDRTAPPKAKVAIAGRLTDDAGMGLAGVTVSAQQFQGQVQAQATSDSQGYYRLEVDSGERPVFVVCRPQTAAGVYPARVSRALQVPAGSANQAGVDLSFPLAEPGTISGTVAPPAFGPHYLDTVYLSQHLMVDGVEAYFRLGSVEAEAEAGGDSETFRFTLAEGRYQLNLTRSRVQGGHVVSGGGQELTVDVSRGADIRVTMHGSMP